MAKKKDFPEEDLREDWEMFDEVVLAETPKKEYDFSNKVKLVLKFSARVKATGPVSGKRYVWERSGAVVEVDSEDVAGLLLKKVGTTACCGGTSGGNELFEIVY